MLEVTGNSGSVHTSIVCVTLWTASLSKALVIVTAVVAVAGFAGCDEGSRRMPRVYGEFDLSIGLVGIEAAAGVEAVAWPQAESHRSFWQVSCLQCRRSEDS